ncbi:MAG TPA: sulfurtransferase [Caulobacteraceae bacterium]|nr:sulfurtransferase [Caulobacteraceae bacterium]
MICRTAIALAVTLVIAAPAYAAGPRDKILVEADWLAQHLKDPNLVILQVGDKAAYDAGHIPGSELIAIAQVAAQPSGADALTLELPDAATLHDRLAAMGISDKSKVVVVHGSDGIQSATRVVFTLDAAGLGDHAVLLDGGLPGWKREGRPTSTEVPTITPGKLAALKMKPLVVDADFVKSHAHATGYSIVDARAPNFYSGAQTGGSAAKPHKTGHVAGAKSVPFSSVTTPDLKFLSAKELEERFKAAGIKKGDTIVTYCHVGQQASATLFAARTLGYKVRLYDGSFEDWSRKDGPVETSAPAAKP